MDKDFMLDLNVYLNVLIVIDLIKNAGLVLSNNGQDLLQILHIKENLIQKIVNVIYLIILRQIILILVVHYVLTNITFSKIIVNFICVLVKYVINMAPTYTTICKLIFMKIIQIQYMRLATVLVSLKMTMTVLNKIDILMN